MEMDINDFGLQKEYFGFGESMYRKPTTRYKQMSRSNTEFLNFGERRKQKQEIDALKNDYFKRIDALPVSDEAGRTALFNELEAKLKEKGESNDAINQARRKAFGEKLVSGVSSALNVFKQVGSALGIGKKIEGETTTNLRNKGVNNPASEPTAKKIPNWVWIVSGVAVVGLGVFAYIKFKK